MLLSFLPIFSIHAGCCYVSLILALHFLPMAKRFKKATSKKITQLERRSGGGCLRIIMPSVKAHFITLVTSIAETHFVIDQALWFSRRSLRQLFFFVTSITNVFHPRCGSRLRRGRCGAPVLAKPPSDKIPLLTLMGLFI